MKKKTTEIELTSKKVILHWRAFNKPTAIYYTVFWSIALLLISLDCIPTAIKAQSLSVFPTTTVGAFCLGVIVLTFCIRGLVRACKREKEND